MRGRVVWIRALTIIWVVVVHLVYAINLTLLGLLLSVDRGAVMSGAGGAIERVAIGFWEILPW